jgi:hypothetical protein
LASDGQITILREHCQGLNKMLFTLPTGGFDPRKNASHLGAAQAELSEEVCVDAEMRSTDIMLSSSGLVCFPLAKKHFVRNLRFSCHVDSC